MEEVSRCLKPGGVAIFVDFDMELLCNDMVTVLPMAMVDQEVREVESTDGGNSTGDDTRAKSPTTEGSWLQRICYGELAPCPMHSLLTITPTFQS